MKDLYIPYNNDKPACILVKGHKLLIVSSEKEDLSNSQYLEMNNTKALEELDPHLSEKFLLEDQSALLDLSEKVKAGVILAPPETSVDFVIKNLEEELPWIQ